MHGTFERQRIGRREHQQRLPVWQQRRIEQRHHWFKRFQRRKRELRWIEQQLGGNHRWLRERQRIE
jgi:hypothetical protein